MFYGASAEIFEKARELRESMTLAEQKLWNQLSKRQLGYKFRRQHPLGNYIADFYCHPLKLVIEVDGSFHETEDQKDYDQGRTAELTDLGIHVIRFKNEDVLENLHSVLKNIKRKVLKIETVSKERASDNDKTRLDTFSVIAHPSRIAIGIPKGNRPRRYQARRHAPFSPSQSYGEQGGERGAQAIKHKNNK